MTIRRIYIKAVLMLLILIVAVFLGLTVFSWVKANHINKDLEKIAASNYIDPKTIDLTQPEIQFAYAYHLQRRNKFESAIKAYIKAERMQINHPEALTKIRYNIANLYLKQAFDVSTKMGIDNAVALADASKQFYRLVLEASPDFMAAKFNYEAAQRLVRDLPQNGESGAQDKSKDAPKDLWSALPSFPHGEP